MPKPTASRAEAYDKKHERAIERADDINRAVLQVVRCRRLHRVAEQRLASLKHVAECYGSDGPSVEHLLKIVEAERGVEDAAAAIVRAIYAAEVKVMHPRRRNKTK